MINKILVKEYEKSGNIKNNLSDHFVRLESAYHITISDVDTGLVSVSYGHD